VPINLQLAEVKMEIKMMDKNKFKKIVQYTLGHMAVMERMCPCPSLV
jgi:hypothetical protein